MISSLLDGLRGSDSGTMWGSWVALDVFALFYCFRVHFYTIAKLSASWSSTHPSILHGSWDSFVDSLHSHSFDGRFHLCRFVSASWIQFNAFFASCPLFLDASTRLQPRLGYLRSTFGIFFQRSETECHQLRMGSECSYRSWLQKSSTFPTTKGRRRRQLHWNFHLRNRYGVLKTYDKLCQL